LPTLFNSAGRRKDVEVTIALVELWAFDGRMLIVPIEHQGTLVQ